MSSSASKAITVVTIGVVVTVCLTVYRTVTDEQLRAMEQCEPACNLGGPLISSPWEVALPGLLLVAVLLVASSLASGWPFGGQMR